MRIQFKESLAGKNINFGRGQIRDLPESEAKYYISRGYAVEAPSDHDKIAKLEAEIERLKGKEKSKNLVRQFLKRKRPLEPASKAKEVSTRPVK